MVVDDRTVMWEVRKRLKTKVSLRGEDPSWLAPVDS
jgi:hypothetical protein